jgi:hypothetical protein
MKLGLIEEQGPVQKEIPGGRLRAIERLRCTFCVAAAAALLVFASLSAAVDVPLPPVNLGETSFQDGIAFPGWLVEETFIYYHADSFTDSNGRDMPGSNRLTTMTAMTHVAWISGFRLLGGFYGAEVLLPLAYLDFDTDSEGVLYGQEQRNPHLMRVNVITVGR